MLQYSIMVFYQYVASEIDDDGNGSISVEEFGQVMYRLADEQINDEVEEMLQQALMTFIRLFKV